MYNSSRSYLSLSAECKLTLVSYKDYGPLSFKFYDKEESYSHFISLMLLIFLQMTTGIPKYLNPRDLPFESEQLSIPYPDDKVFVEYIVVNNTRLDTLSKTRILDFEPKEVKGT